MFLISFQKLCSKARLLIACFTQIRQVKKPCMNMKCLSTENRQGWFLLTMDESTPQTYLTTLLLAVIKLLQKLLQPCPASKLSIQLKNQGYVVLAEAASQLEENGGLARKHMETLSL